MLYNINIYEKVQLGIYLKHLFAYSTLLVNISGKVACYISLYCQYGYLVVSSRVIDLYFLCLYILEYF